MRAAARPYVLASAALLATSLVVATPIGAPPLHIPVRSIEARLVDDSVLNIPVNLFDDILNIPYNEVQALNIGAASLLDTGTWWVPGSTNIWGIDPGDITHVAAIFGFDVPFPAFDDGVGGLDYEVDGLLAAELPVNASCDAATCAPIVPPDVITGSTSQDRGVGLFESLLPQNQFGLFDNWFHVPLQDLLSGYTFTEANDPGVIDPSGPANIGFGFPLDGGSNPFEGSTTLVDGQNAMPWDGLTYTLNPLQPFENFYESLLATPSTSGILGTGVELPTFTELFQGLQTGAAGLVIDFDPLTEGAPPCPATCDIPASLTIAAIVQDIENLDPSNTTLQTWLNDYAAGTAAGPTQSQMYEAIAMLQVGDYNLTPAQLATVDADLASVNPELPYLYTNGGLLTDPGYLAYTDATASTTTGATTTATFDPVYGGANVFSVPEDLVKLLTNNEWNFNALSEPGVATALGDPGLIVSDPGAFSAGATDPGALLGGSDGSATASDLANLGALLGLSGASTISTDLSALLSTVSADLSAALSAELGPQLSTELASILPTAILSGL
jgi:hypothetical protein